MMPKRWVLYSLLPFLLLGCRTFEMASQWQKSPLVPAENEKGWASLKVHRLESIVSSLSAANDGQALYLLIRTEDPSIASNLMKRGISLSFTGEKEKEPSLQIQYTGTDSLRRPVDPMDSFWNCLTLDQKDRFRSSRLNQERLLFAEQRNRVFRIPSKGAAARILEKGSFGYAFRIPLNAGDAFGVRSRPGEWLKLGIRFGDRSEGASGMVRNGRVAFARMGGLTGPGRTQKQVMPESEIQIRILLAGRSIDGIPMEGI